MDVPVPAAELEDEDHHQDREGDAQQPGQDDVGRAGRVEEDQHQGRVQHAPEVVEPLQVPEPGPVGGPEANLLGQIGDLPVVVDVAVPAVPSVLGVGQEEDAVKAGGEGSGRDHRQQPARSGRGRRLGGQLGLAGLALDL